MPCYIQCSFGRLNGGTGIVFTVLAFYSISSIEYYYYTHHASIEINVWTKLKSMRLAFIRALCFWLMLLRQLADDSPRTDGWRRMPEFEKLLKYGERAEKNTKMKMMWTERVSKRAAHTKCVDGKELTTDK